MRKSGKSPGGVHPNSASRKRRARKHKAKARRQDAALRAIVLPPSQVISSEHRRHRPLIGDLRALVPKVPVRSIRLGLTDTPSRFAAGFLTAAIAVLGIGSFVSTPWHSAGDQTMPKRIAHVASPAKETSAKVIPIRPEPIRSVAVRSRPAEAGPVRSTLVAPASIAPQPVKPGVATPASVVVARGNAKPEPPRRNVEPPRRTRAAGPPLARPRQEPFNFVVPASLSPSYLSFLDPSKAKDAERCSPHARQLSTRSRTPESVVVDLDPTRFGEQLAVAALRQLKTFVIYNPRYMRISYPMGDVPAMYGVCTDVIIRAYRRLGVDLQMLVRLSKLGTGDTSIDHRRVQVLRKFFARYGFSLPITKVAVDYEPGDIVTYQRPSGRTSTAHIALVTALKSPDGIPMRVHNTGGGVQLDGGTFKGKISGHYRFTDASELAGAVEAELLRIAALQTLASSRSGRTVRKVRSRRHKSRRLRLTRKFSRAKRRAKNRRRTRSRRLALLASKRRAAPHRARRMALGASSSRRRVNPRKRLRKTPRTARARRHRSRLR